MTTTQAIHLIEQFAAQAPFAVWITDSRGITIFANKRLHEMLEIPDHPSGALGIDLFDDPGFASLGIGDLGAKARAGESIEAVLDIPEPDAIKTDVPVGRKDPITLRLVGYALRSSTQQVEHYVIMLTDVTESTRNRQQLKLRLHDLSIYNKSRITRLERLKELEEDVERLEKEVIALGGKPVA